MALAEMIQCSVCVQRPPQQPYPAFLVLSEPALTHTSDLGKPALSRRSIHAEENGPKTAGFFDLPAELRLQIYERCVSEIQVQSPFDHRFKKVNAVKHRVTDYFLLPVLFADSTFPLSLVQTSKRMASEAIDAIYRLVSFELITTHSSYMFAYDYYLSKHPMRYTEQLTLRLVHDIWSSRRYESVPRLRSNDWSRLASLIGAMPNLRQLSVRIFHNSQNDDVDFVDEYAKRGMDEMVDGLRTIQLGLRNSTNFEVEFAAPESDFVDPGQRDRLVEFLRSKQLPVACANLSWTKVCTQDNGAYIWNPAEWSTGITQEATQSDDPDEKPVEWA